VTRPPTVILMLKAPVAGAVKTRLAATLGAAEAVVIYRGLVERQVRALPAGWPATVHYDPPGAGAWMRRWLGPLRAGRTGLRFSSQCAGDLGQRLTLAFAREFARGAEAVVAVGGDCPGLDAAGLRAAAVALRTADAVLGPAADGGYYLLGLRRPAPSLFVGVDWSTPKVLVQTCARLRAAGLTWAELTVREDIDDAAGWARWLARRGKERRAVNEPVSNALAERLARQKREHPREFLLDARDLVGLGAWLHGAGVLAEGERVRAAAKAGEGNMNCTLRVVTSRRSLIVKQARPWVEKYPQFAAPRDRARREIEFYAAAAGMAAVAARMPRLLHGDRGARALVLEDCGSGGDYADIYRGGAMTRSDAGTLAAWLSELHGAFCGGPKRRRPANRAMRALNARHIFFLPFEEGSGPDLEVITPGLGAVAAALWRDRVLVERVRALAAVYLGDGDCLLHGDFFPGSFLRTTGGPKIIDPEFAFFGRPEFDTAVFLAHLLLAGRHGAARARFLRDYRRPAGFDEALMWRLAGVEMMRRLLGFAQLPLRHGLSAKTRLLMKARALVLGT
jgi:5-methylthioribose kinase